MSQAIGKGSRKTRNEVNRSGSPPSARGSMAVQERAGYAQDLPTSPVNKTGAASPPSHAEALAQGFALADNSRMSARPHGYSEDLLPEESGVDVTHRPAMRGTASRGSYTQDASARIRKKIK